MRFDIIHVKYVAAHKQFGADHIPWNDSLVTPQQAYGLVAFECETKATGCPMHTAKSN